MHEIILLTLSGEDKPGVTSAITGILANYRISILDIGQAVIHNTLSLGILIQVPGEAESSPLMRDILFKAHELNLQVRFEPVSDSDYGLWVEGQGKTRHSLSRRHAGMARSTRACATACGRYGHGHRGRCC